MWKMNRRLSQKDGAPQQGQPGQQLPPPTSHNQNKGPVNSKMVGWISNTSIDNNHKKKQ